MIYASNLQIRKLSVSDVAIAYRIPRKTVLKHIRNGDIKVNNDKLLDYYQVVNFFGEPENPKNIEKDLYAENQELKARISFLEKMLSSNQVNSSKPVFDFSI